MEVNNSLLQMILDQSPVGMAVLNFDRTVRYCNPAFRKIYGWDDDEILGAKLPLPSHQKKSFNELLEELRSDRSVIGVETVRVRKDGSEFYARISAAPLYNSSGTADGFIACITVAEENYSDQLELRNLEYLIQGSSDFMCVTDLELRVLFINDPGRAMIGLRQDQNVDGMHLLEFFADESRSRLAGIFQSLQPAEAGLSVQMRLKHLGSGALIPVSSSVYVVNDPHTGEPISIGCVAKNLAELDDSARRAEGSESAFRTLMDHVSAGVALVDPSGRLVGSNQALQELLGYSAEELMHMPFSDHVHPEDLVVGRPLFLQLVAGTIENYVTFKRLRHRNGHTVPTQMNVFLVRDIDGSPKHTISIVQPVTDLGPKPAGSLGAAAGLPDSVSGNSSGCQ